MKKILKNLILTIFFAFPISVFASGGISVSPSSLTIEQGSSKTFTITAINTIGDVSIYSNNSGVASVSTGEWETGMVDEGQTKYGTITVYGNSIGTATITLNIDAATFDSEDLSGQIRTVTVNVVAKSTSQPHSNTTKNNNIGNKDINNDDSSRESNVSKNNNLKEISVEGYKLVKVNNNSYTLTVNNNVSSINIKAIAEDSKATVAGIGSRKLNIGENNIEVIITSESGEKNKVLLKITRKDAYYLEDLDEALKDTTIKSVDIVIKQNSKLISEYLNKIKESGRTVNFNYIDGNKRLIYSWIVDGSKIKKTKDFLTTVVFTSKNKKEINNLVNYAEGINISVSEKNEIPKGTKLRIYVGDKYSNGEVVNIYSYDKKNNKLVLVDNNISVKDGYLEFNVDKNREYFITKADLSRLQVTDGFLFDFFKTISIIELIVIILLGIYFMKKIPNLKNHKITSGIELPVSESDNLSMDPSISDFDKSSNEPSNSGSEDLKIELSNSASEELRIESSNSASEDLKIE